MTNLTTTTGKTRTELENFYIATINTLMGLGMNETDARAMVQETMKATINEMK